MLPDDLVVAVENTDLLRRLMPCTGGGSELDLPIYIQVIEEIAQTDASTAWCVNRWIYASLLRLRRLAGGSFSSRRYLVTVRRAIFTCSAASTSTSC
jgi:hypothetical protein